jgi:ribosome-associated protein
MLTIAAHISIPDAELIERFVRAPGPGGQNVNKVATAVQLRFDPVLSGLPQDVLARLRGLAGRRFTQQGDMLITAQRYRTQERNRQAALDTLIALIQRAALPPVPRVATRPTLASKRRRLQTKAHRGRVKHTRSTLPDDQ